MSRKIIYNLVLIWTILSGSALYAQTISGTVSDKNGTLPAANVVVKGTGASTVTDLNGQYIISASPNDVLVFSYIGYTTQEITVTVSNTINVVLAEDAQNLNEVVVTGYVGQQKRSITGAVSQVNMENLSKTRIPDVAQALQGQVAGVFVAANTGAPGDGIKLRVRGEGTFRSNEALFIIDGVPTRDISFLNQNDIKSMTVLKDAASAAIYGSRASGGVVIITTKKGQEGKASFDVDLFTGIHYTQNLPELLNTDQYLTVKDQAWHNTTGNSATAESPYAFDRRTRTDLADTDWLDELFTTGLSKNVQVSASGASDKVRYLVSGGYYGIDGVVTEKNDTYKRVNFRTNIDADLSDRFKVGTNLQISFQSQDKLSSAGDAPGVIRHAMIRPPVLSVYKDPSDPTYSARDPYTDLPFYTGPNGGWLSRYEFSSNPLAIVHFTDDTRERFQTFGNVFAEFAFLKEKELKFRSNLGIDATFAHNKIFAENYGDPNEVLAPDHPYFGLGRNNKPNNLSENRGQDVTLTWSNTLNYVKTINDTHNINLLAGSELIKNRQSTIGGTRSYYDLYDEQFRFLDNGSLGSDIISRPYASGSDTRWSLVSFFASATYGYKDRYYASATMRADGSSRFGPNNKWGYFPAFSAGWTVSNEEFMKDVNWLSNLRLRGSWGKNGNQEIPNDAYQTFVQYTPEGPRVIRYGNDDLKWEAVVQTDFGIDLGLFENKLSFSADYFRKTTDDIILALTLPGAAGNVGVTFVNAGEVVNKGFEFALGYQNNDNEFKYGISANLATVDNEVTKLHPNVRLLEDSNAHVRSVVGQPLNSYYGYVFDGIYQNAAEVSSHLYTNAGTTQPGDMKFKDLNGDGQIDANDRTFIGNPNPKVTYGFAFNASYKNFDISFLFQGVEGVDRYNDLKQILDYDSRPFNSSTDVLGAWNGEGSTNSTPRVTFNDNGGSKVSSKFVEDASYLRLKNIEIGYTFKDAFKGLTNMRIYVSGQNMLTWTKYSGLDPESTQYKDQGTYPQTSAVIFGARIKL